MVEIKKGMVEGRLKKKSDTRREWVTDKMDKVGRGGR